MYCICSSVNWCNNKQKTHFKSVPVCIPTLHWTVNFQDFRFAGQIPSVGQHVCNAGHMLGPFRKG